jgi:hypothetical protein
MKVKSCSTKIPGKDLLGGEHSNSTWKPRTSKVCRIRGVCFLKLHGPVKANFRWAHGCKHPWKPPHLGRPGKHSAWNTGTLTPFSKSYSTVTSRAVGHLKRSSFLPPCSWMGMKPAKINKSLFSIKWDSQRRDRYLFMLLETFTLPPPRSNRLLLVSWNVQPRCHYNSRGLGTDHGSPLARVYSLTAYPNAYQGHIWIVLILHGLPFWLSRCTDLFLYRLVLLSCRYFRKLPWAIFGIKSDMNR